jgi:hypothetical protein
LNEFPRKDGDRFLGNMGDEMILMGGCFYLLKQFDYDKEQKLAKKDFDEKRRSAKRSADKSE